MNDINIIENSAKRYSNTIAVFDVKNNIKKTYAELFQEIHLCTMSFLKMGIEHNDKICIFSENNGNWFAVEQGIERAGGISVLRGSKLSPNAELEYIYNNSDAVGLITDDIKIFEYFKVKIKNFYKRNKVLVFLKTFNNIDEFDREILDYNGLLNYAKGESYSLPKLEEQDTAVIVYSSGTSGHVKGVMLSHYAIAYIGDVNQKRIKLKPNKKAFLINPLWHSGFFVNTLYLMSIGTTIIMLSKDTYLNALKKYKPEYLEVVPKTFDNLYNSYFEIVDSYKPIKKFLFYKFLDYAIKYRYNNGIIKNKISRKFNMLDYIKALFNCFILFIPDKIAKYLFLYPLRRFFVVNRPLLYTAGVALDKQVEDFFNVIGIRTIQKYGLSESCAILTNQSEKHSKYYTVGKPHIGVEIKIIDLESGKELPSYSRGIILAKGPQIMNGYYNNPEATRNIFSDGFLNTGDIGFLDDDGYLTYVGRCKDIIVLQNGENVDAIEIEAKCREIPYIKQIVLCGQDKIYLTAIVILKENIEVSKENILSDINNKNIERASFKQFEKIKNIFVLKSDEIKIEDFYTNTQKFKRYKFYETYKNQIDALYN